MVRNALAHSSYEVTDDNCIRLSHYNHETKKVDMNVLLSKDVVIPIIDIINEVYYNLIFVCIYFIIYSNTRYK